MEDERGIHRQLLADILSINIKGMSPVAGGYSGAPKYLAALSNGETVFVKGASTDYATQGLRREILAYQTLSTPLMPTMLGYSENPPLLVLPDLSAARWPPPWEVRDILTLMECIESLHAEHAPSLLKSANGPGAALTGGWADVDNFPNDFLNLGLCSQQWLINAIDALRSADELNNFEGNSLLHFDLRSDNMCLTRSGWRFVDWSSVDIGVADLDVVLWLPSLVKEIGHLPAVFRDYARNPLMVSFAGYLAAQAGRPEPEGASGAVRALQQAQLQIALPMACSIVGVAAP